LPGNEEGNFEEIKQLGGPRFAFVETDGLSFLVQHTPKNLGPSWAECLSIEYRPIWGGIPNANVREAIAAITSFLLGRDLVNVGHTRFAADGLPISQVARNPQKDNLVSLCQREDGRTPVEIDTYKAEGGIEPLLRQLVPNYLTLTARRRGVPTRGPRLARCPAPGAGRGPRCTAPLPVPARPAPGPRPPS
jgi:hypothetical protein